MLNPKQQKFVDKYLETGNATRSYKEIYKCKDSTAKTNGPLLLENTGVREAIYKLQQRVQVKVTEKLVITRESLIADAETIKKRCMQGEPVYDRQGNPTGEWRFEGFAALKALELQAKFTGVADGPTGQGDDSESKGFVIGRVRATLNKLSKRQGS